MLESFVLLSCFFSIAGFGFLNRIFYAVYRPWCKKINTHLVTVSAHRIFALFSTYLGFRVQKDYSGVDELPEQYLLIANHQSLLDILVFMDYFDGSRLRFVAKKELGSVVPVISLVLKSDQHCLVQRKGGMSQAMKAMDHFAVRVKKNNWIPVLFPEGTRSRTGKVGQFYSAGFRRFLAGAPMPIVVAALEGGYKISSLRQMLLNSKGGSYRVKVLKVFPCPTTKEEQLAVLAEGKGLIEAQLAQWRAEKE